MGQTAGGQLGERLAGSGRRLVRVGFHLVVALARVGHGVERGLERVRQRGAELGAGLTGALGDRHGLPRLLAGADEADGGGILVGALGPQVGRHHRAGLELERQAPRHGRDEDRVGGIPVGRQRLVHLVPGHHAEVPAGHALHPLAEADTDLHGIRRVGGAADVRRGHEELRRSVDDRPRVRRDLRRRRGGRESGEHQGRGHGSKSGQQAHSISLHNEIGSPDGASGGRCAPPLGEEGFEPPTSCV